MPDLSPLFCLVGGPGPEGGAKLSWKGWGASRVTSAPRLLLHCSHGFLQEVPDLRERELGFYLFSSSVFWLGTFCPGLWEGQDCLHLERRGQACVIT